MKVTRRSFLQLTAAGGAAVVASQLLLDEKFGTLLESKALTAETALTEEFLYTTCWIGKQDCGMIARKVNGRIVKLEGDPANPRNKGKLCVKGQGQIMAFYDPYRLKAPLKRVNGKGVSGEWVETTWEEAMTLVGDKIAALPVDATSGKRYGLVWQKGRSKTEPLYDNAFVKASKAGVKLGHGAYCSDAGYRACEYTIGYHAVAHPDFENCNYLLSWAWNLTGAGGNKTCWITWNQEFVEARERGMKVVALDPMRRGVGPHADEWLPIKPATDLAFFLALANVLVEKGYIDTEYLKKYTNAPSLVKADGYLLKDASSKEQVWDPSTSSAVPFGTAGVDLTLEGEFTLADGSKVKPSFQLFKEHIAQYTPEWASAICDIPAATIRRIAAELGENAMIGRSVIVDGVTVPYRPVGLMAYHISQQELGVQAIRAAVMVFMLLGAVEAMGGMRSDYAGKTDKTRYDKLGSAKVGKPPYKSVSLDGSKFWPINTNNPSIAAHVMNNPTKYEFDEAYLPKVMIIHMTNPLLSFADQPALKEAYKKFEFIAVIDPWLSETADLFADLILPAATIEKIEGPLSTSTQYESGSTLRLPPMDPLFQTRGEVDIYLDLSEKAGFLTGAGGYIDNINTELKLGDPYKLDLNTKPTVEQVFDNWAKNSGYADGLKAFKDQGVLGVKKYKTAQLYGVANKDASGNSSPYGGLIHRLYGETLKRLQDEMKAERVEELYYQDYTAFPTWRTPTMDKSPSQYDLYLISYKKIEYKQSRATFNPLLNELEHQQHLIISSVAAASRGISDGDRVTIESHNAVTGETRKVNAVAEVVKGIRPDTVALSHHYGFWVNPTAKEGGPTPNEIFFSGPGYVTNTADQSFHVKVRVYKE